MKRAVCERRGDQCWTAPIECPRTENDGLNAAAFASFARRALAVIEFSSSNRRRPAGLEVGDDEGVVGRHSWL